MPLEIQGGQARVGQEQNRLTVAIQFFAERPQGRGFARLSRLPYAERRNLLSRLEETGREWASSPLGTDSADCWPMVEVSGRVPHRGRRSETG